MNSPSRRPATAFVGLGYVGLSTAVCFASRGFKAKGIDIDEDKINAIRRGDSPFHEKGLAQLLLSSLRKKTLQVGSSFDDLKESDVIFITVGTPSAKDGSIDTTFVEAASREIGRQLATADGYHVVVVKSTVIPGTTEGKVLPTLESVSGRKVGADFGLAVNPEFLREGSAIEETLHPDALVIGARDKKSSDFILRMYRTFYKRVPPTILTTPSNAEMIKYAINSARATQVSFVNTLANLCSKVPNSDMREVRRALSLIGRMDERYLGSGLGFGGSCLPKDTRALISFARATRVNDEILAAALSVNDRQTAVAVEMAENLVSLSGKRVSVLGLAFKPGTDDVRESASVRLVKHLVERGARVSVYDPQATDNARNILGDSVQYAKTSEECLRGSECCFVATDWSEFRTLKPSTFKRLMREAVVIDCRRVYVTAEFLRAGVKFAKIGTSAS